MRMADHFSEKSSQTYIPYILDMIVENLIDDGDASLEGNILKFEDTNDYLIGKACEREIKKLNNVGIDEQLSILICIAIKYNGTVHEDHFTALGQVLRNRHIENLMDKFKGHPLLMFDNNARTLRFRYDFFNAHFKNIGLALFLNNPDSEKIDLDMLNIIVNLISYDNVFMKNLKKRFDPKKYCELKDFIFLFLNEREKFSRLCEINGFNEDDQKKISSSLFVTLLALLTSDGVKERTSLLKDLYQKHEGVIEDLAIINLHSTKKLVFDFKGLRFKNCTFENYEYFSACIFDAKTFFEYSKFTSSLHREKIKSTMNKNNFSEATCDLSGIIDVISTNSTSIDGKALILREHLKKIFRYFWQNSAFKQRCVSKVTDEFKDIPQILHLLLEFGVIKEDIATSHKPHEKTYSVSTEYSNLRKIMEENKTCSEFEKVVKFFP